MDFWENYAPLSVAGIILLKQAFGYKEKKVRPCSVTAGSLAKGEKVQ